MSSTITLNTSELLLPRRESIALLFGNIWRDAGLHSFCNAGSGSVEECLVRFFQILLSACRLLLTLSGEETAVDVARGWSSTGAGVFTGHNPKEVCGPFRQLDAEFDGYLTRTERVAVVRAEERGTCGNTSKCGVSLNRPQNGKRCPQNGKRCERLLLTRCQIYCLTLSGWIVRVIHCTALYPTAALLS